MVACARLLRGESEEAIGKAVGLCAATICRIEKGRCYSLTYKKLAELCIYLEIPVRNKIPITNFFDRLQNGFGKK
jgi:transcriptional regulator with XRE-family HTH domain